MTSRYRVRAAQLKAEAGVQQALREASGALKRAQSLYGLIIMQKGPVSVEGRRSKENAKMIGQALNLLRNVHGVSPRWDMDDPDLLPEEVRVQMFRDAKKAEESVEEFLEEDSLFPELSDPIVE